MISRLRAATCWLALLLCGAASWADVGPPTRRCGNDNVCVVVLPPALATGTACEGKALQLFHRNGAPSVLWCTTPNQPEDSLALVLDPDRPSGRTIVVEGSRVLRSLDGVLEQGVPDRFAAHPVCQASRGIAGQRPDVRPGRVVLLVKVPADPYCFDVYVATLGQQGVELVGAAGTFGRELSMAVRTDLDLAALAVRALKLRHSEAAAPR